MAQFINQARLSYNGIVVDSNAAVGEFADSVTVFKHAISDGYSVGDEITYVISIVGTGDVCEADMTVTDDLGAYDDGGGTLYPLAFVSGTETYYRNGTLMPAPTVTSAFPLTVTGLSVPAGGCAMLIYKAYVTGYADPNANGTITNTATVDSASFRSPVTAAETVRAKTAANLSITKSLRPTVITGVGGRLTYTLLIQNYGNAAAEESDNVVITDTFSPVLRGLNVTLNGGAFPPSAYSYSETTGVFSTVGGQITVPAASFSRTASGEWTTVPGSVSLEISGTV